MEKQTAVDSLKESIRVLEIRQIEEGVLFKEQFKLTIESLKPVNLLKSSFKEMIGSVELKNGLFETVISLISGYISKKMITNSKSNPFMKILGGILQFGVTSVVAQNVDNIRDFLSNLIDRFLHKEVEEISEEEV
jgi:hypothetical protein